MLTRASLSPTPTHPKVGKARGRIHVLSTWNPQPGRLTDGRGTPSWRPKFFCFPVGLSVWREGPRARASLRSLKSHNLGFPSSSFTGEGGHPAGGVARAASPRAGVALQCAPQTPRGLGSGEQRTPKSLCPARRGKVRARAQRRRRLPQMREARAEKTRRAAPSAPPLRPPSPGVGGGEKK